MAQRHGESDERNIRGTGGRWRGDGLKGRGHSKDTVIRGGEMRNDEKEMRVKKMLEEIKERGVSGY